MGELLGIATHPRKRAPLELHESRGVGRETGLAGDFRGSARGRSVTVLGREGWEAACRALGCDLDWTTRRANLLVEGLDLEQTKGARLRVGEVLLEVTGECDPCHVMDAQRDGLRRALEREWRGGVMCVVLEEGTLRVGDTATLEPAP